MFSLIDLLPHLQNEGVFPWITSWLNNLALINIWSRHLWKPSWGLILARLMPYALLLLQVISNMRVLMTEDSNNAVSSSFLLDDDSRLDMIKLLCYSDSLFYLNYLCWILDTPTWIRTLRYFIHFASKSWNFFNEIANLDTWIHIHVYLTQVPESE